MAPAERQRLLLEHYVDHINLSTTNEVQYQKTAIANLRASLLLIALSFFSFVSVTNTTRWLKSLDDMIKHLMVDVDLGSLEPAMSADEPPHNNQEL